MTEEQNKRLEQLTSLLIDRCISEPEYIEYQKLSEIVLLDMKNIPARKKVSDNY